MKTHRRFTGRPPFRIRRLFGLALVAGVLACSPSSLRAQLYVSDNFNDGNANGWTPYDVLAPFGLNATFSFPNGGYRIQTRYVTGMPTNPGRAGSSRPEVYTDFYVAVDVVNWDDTLPQSFGLLARVQTPGLQTTTGYAFTWDRGNTNNPNAGDLDITRVTGEVPAEIASGPNAFRFQPGHKYRMVFIGRGTVLQGRVYETTDLANPLITIQGTDTDLNPYLSGQNGLVTFDGNSGRSFTDATFDNYFATDIEPPRLALLDLNFGDYQVSWPLESVGFVLQTSTAATGGNWEDVPEAEIVQFPDHYGYFFAVNPDGPNRFFRLIRR